MKKLLLATALLGAATMSAANVAFLKPASPSTQENGALTYFQNSGLGQVVDAAAATDLSGYDCIWIHVDRIGMPKGWENLPEEIKNKKDALAQYVKDGGNLYLSGFASQLVAGIGRTNYAQDIYGSGNGGNGDDCWAVSSWVDTDRSSHPIYAGLTPADGYAELGYTAYGLLYGGGPAILREDHNCVWDIHMKVPAFEADNNAKVLGTWGQFTTGGGAGIVEFLPQAQGEGTIMVNGLAAYQWVVENGTNVCQANIEGLTKNIIEYLCSEKQGGGEGPVEPIIPDDPTEPEFEVPSCNGKVALLVPFTTPEALLASYVENGAVQLFKSLVPTGTVLYNDYSNLSAYDCVWVNIEKDNIGAGWQNLGVDQSLVDALATYLAQGGNLYFTKHAVQLVQAIGRTNDPAAEFGNTDPNNVLTRTDLWQTNVSANGTDWSGHTMFHGVNIDNADYGKLVTLLGLGTQHYDRNCMYKLNELGGHDAFCANNKARVLGTWGHNGGQAWAGIVEFLPKNPTPQYAISQAKRDARKGTVIVNGLAAYHFAPLNGSVNPSQAEINALTSNTLAYLAPNYVNIESGVEAVVAEGETKWYTLDGVEVENPVKGLYVKVEGGKAVKVLVK